MKREKLRMLESPLPMNMNMNLSYVSSTSTMDDITKEKRFICYICHQKFKRKYSLNEHIKTHTGERPYTCTSPDCKKTFTTSGNLSRHKKVHHYDENTYDCLLEECCEIFTSIHQRDQHMRIHCGERPFHCKSYKCNRRYNTTNGLMRHYAMKHTSYGKGYRNSIGIGNNNTINEDDPVGYVVALSSGNAQEKDIDGIEENIRPLKLKAKANSDTRILKNNREESIINDQGLMKKKSSIYANRQHRHSVPCLLPSERQYFLDDMQNRNRITSGEFSCWNSFSTGNKRISRAQEYTKSSPIDEPGNFRFDHFSQESYGTSWRPPPNVAEIPTNSTESYIPKDNFALCDYRSLPKYSEYSFGIPAINTVINNDIIKPEVYLKVESPSPMPGYVQYTKMMNDANESDIFIKKEQRSDAYTQNEAEDIMLDFIESIKEEDIEKIEIEKMEEEKNDVRTKIESNKRLEQEIDTNAMKNLFMSDRGCVNTLRKCESY